MVIKKLIDKLIGLFTIPRCPVCGGKLEPEPHEEGEEPTSYKCINCGKEWT